MTKQPILFRFFSKVSKTGSCWFWTGVKSCGYGYFFVGKKKVRAHRFSWEIHNGKHIPNGMVIMHLCDNPSCVNPKHLRLGTQQDNIADSVLKKLFRNV